MKRRVLVVGSGKRVREAALPALAQLEQDFELVRVAARTAKRIRAGERDVEVVALDGLRPDWIEGLDLVYLAVTKDAVPAVLARLTAFDVSRTDVLIDTPVVRFKHYRHVARLEAFRNAWVAEDCTVLPWFDVVRDAIAGGAIGELRSVLFHRSAYAYHGVATAKALLESKRVLRGLRRRGGDGLQRRELVLEGGRLAVMVEPRDYSVGHVRIEGTQGSISDAEGEADHLLAPIVADGRWTGFRVGSRERRLDPHEAALLDGGDPAARLTARMDDLKRVGFLRLLAAIRDGRGGYPVADAIDDMVVDYHLEKLGRYRDNPLTSPRYALGRLALSALTRLGGG